MPTLQYLTKDILLNKVVVNKSAAIWSAVSKCDQSIWLMTIFLLVQDETAKYILKSSIMLQVAEFVIGILSLTFILLFK